MDLQQLFDQSRAHHMAGRLDQAEAGYRQVLTAAPNAAPALHVMGVLCWQTGRNAEAFQLISRAISLDANQPDYHSDLAILLTRAGNHGDAVASAQRALNINPSHWGGCVHMAEALVGLRKPGEAESFARRAVQLEPNQYPSRYILAVSLQGQGRAAEAVPALRAALELEPKNALCIARLGRALRDVGQVDEAIDVTRAGLLIAPGLPEMHVSLAEALGDRLETRLGVEHCRKAMFSDPLYPSAHSLRANLLLRLGEFEEGALEFEWRWQAHPGERTPFREPTWMGQQLNGETVLVHGEQGYGDTILFIRYATEVEKRGGKALCKAHNPLRRLFERQPQLKHVIGEQEEVPPFDYIIPVASMPLACGTTRDTIPGSAVPYLRADVKDVERWNARLSGAKGKIKVGLSWSGRVTNEYERRRPIALKSLAPLARVPGVTFVSLQTGPAATQSPPDGMDLIDLSGELTDFADTAAIMDNLDLVITIDTAAAHLAGAMGRPVWTMIPYAPYWVWLEGRSDSPWYPSMTLLRQRKLGEWEPVIEEAARMLAEFVKNSGR